MRLRPVTAEDCRMLWQWANDPVVRAGSFSWESIAWDDHLKWIETKLSDPNCRFYILLNDEDAAVGQVRFEASDGEAEISVSIVSDFRCNGYGAAGIKTASENLFQETAITQIFAYVKEDNLPSLRAFEKAGYELVEVKIEKGHHSRLFNLSKHKVIIGGDLV